eukprot:jgi/Ulvmu1/9294/UM050_0043.1
MCCTDIPQLNTSHFQLKSGTTLHSRLGIRKLCRLAAQACRTSPHGRPNLPRNNLGFSCMTTRISLEGAPQAAHHPWPHLVASVMRVPHEATGPRHNFKAGVGQIDQPSGSLPLHSSGLTAVDDQEQHLVYDGGPQDPLVPLHVANSSSGLACPAATHATEQLLSTSMPQQRHTVADLSPLQHLVSPDVEHQRTHGHAALPATSNSTSESQTSDVAGVLAMRLPSSTGTAAPEVQGPTVLPYDRVARVALPVATTSPSTRVPAVAAAHGSRKHGFAGDGSAALILAAAAEAELARPALRGTGTDATNDVIGAVDTAAPAGVRGAAAAEEGCAEGGARPARVRKKSAKAAEMDTDGPQAKGKESAKAGHAAPVGCSGGKEVCSSAGAADVPHDSAEKEQPRHSKRARAVRSPEHGTKPQRGQHGDGTSEADADTSTVGSGGRSRGHRSASLIKGVYHKELSNAFEAQLTLDPYRKLLKAHGHPHLDDAHSQYYLGLYRYIVDKPEDKEAARDLATRAVDRVTLKVLKGKVPDSVVESMLHFSLSDYVDPRDEHMRAVLTNREYAAQMLILGYRRHHEAQGSPLTSRLGVYPKKSRKDGLVRSWEVRVTHTKIKSFSTYPTVEEAARAYDLGIILLYGTRKRLNNPLTAYYACGKLLADVIIPAQVAVSVALYIEHLTQADEEAVAHTGLQMMQRICGYFGDAAQLPSQFQSYPQLVAEKQDLLSGDPEVSPRQPAC